VRQNHVMGSVLVVGFPDEEAAYYVLLGEAFVWRHALHTLRANVQLVIVFAGCFFEGSRPLLRSLIRFDWRFWQGSLCLRTCFHS